ncbi:MAG TPA: thiol peroxidase [Candidatus Krumholzibacteria bacterium]|nr:thiol peroxidase [Candidatus Krumholzibacteria bacterium]
MTIVTLKGKPFRTIGELPKAGSTAPNFTLTAQDLTEKALWDFRGKDIVLNIFPSIDTSVCATSVRKFSEAATQRSGVVVIGISADLPFAFKRFGAAEGIENIVMLSTFRNPAFGTDYGVRIVEGPYAGLMSRAIVVIDEAGKVVYTEQVAEIEEEPNYDAALAKL